MGATGILKSPGHRKQNSPFEICETLIQAGHLVQYEQMYLFIKNTDKVSELKTEDACGQM